MQETTESRLPAGVWPRAAAYLIDRAILLVALFFVHIPLLFAKASGAALFNDKLLFGYRFAQILCYLLVTAYFVLLTCRTGRTPGKAALHLRVVTADGEPLRFWNVLYRETIGRYLSSLLCVGYIMAAVDRSHRALHDYLCDTLVVYDHEKTEKKPRIAPEPGRYWSEGSNDCPYECDSNSEPDEELRG